jgi:hypothetical protein
VSLIPLNKSKAGTDCNDAAAAVRSAAKDSRKILARFDVSIDPFDTRGSADQPADNCISRSASGISRRAMVKSSRSKRDHQLRINLIVCAAETRKMR